ncbi:MAG: sigma-70 family RNA polymerase sigma factor [Anaerolineales bacterium]
MVKTRSNEEWLHELADSGSIQEAALSDLRELLLRAALYFFSRNLGDFRDLSRDDILQRAEDCAQDALIAILDHLTDFRGDSKFTTWAYKFSINISMVTARRERWKRVSLDELTADEGSSIDKFMRDISDGIPPEQVALQTEVQQIIRDGISADLTERQRQVLVWMVIHEVPLDVVVEHLGTNRNAVYKLLHDARRKLKSRLQLNGFDVSETLSLFNISE